jgi:hypothetical protein
MTETLNAKITPAITKWAIIITEGIMSDHIDMECNGEPTNGCKNIIGNWYTLYVLDTWGTTEFTVETRDMGGRTLATVPFKESLPYTYRLREFKKMAKDAAVKVTAMIAAQTA